MPVGTVGLFLLEKPGPTLWYERLQGLVMGFWDLSLQVKESHSDQVTNNQKLLLCEGLLVKCVMIRGLG